MTNPALLLRYGASEHRLAASYHHHQPSDETQRREGRTLDGSAGR
jgi:hypothetical protein